MLPPNLNLASERHRWHISGQVQGVGFRPFVFKLAQQHRLTGFVRNEVGRVVVEAQGPIAELRRFAEHLETQKPPLAVLEQVSCTVLPLCDGESGFQIMASLQRRGLQPEVTVDTALCPDCLTELLDPHDRRFQHALINCTNCGPRYSIIRRVPYDRPNTTMAGFDMCAICRAEYIDPADRRFHAQPIACPDCGPQLSLLTPQGQLIDGDPIDVAVEQLAAGHILAIKGLGGFHLAVRADHHAGVLRLRELKKRDAKPFALMCANVPTAARLVELSDAAAVVLASPAAPIVLAARRHDAPIANAVAPHNHRLGVMLPYTPIHHLLFARGQFDVLVMTSGNISDEPLVIDNDEAVQRLGNLCDAILLHDRPIERCVDDSVVLDMGVAAPLPIRRARGYVPAAIAIPLAAPSMGLCVGGELKNTVAAVREDRVILSQHLGDLTHAKGFESFKRAIDDLRDLFAIEPRWIAHDLHPMYLSTQHARELSRKLGVELIAVQHHHAHAAAVMAEHGVSEPVLAVVCDGTGFGTDGTIWGGELLLTSLASCHRLGRLKPLWLAGGDAAARDTRRCGLALLHAAFGDAFDEHPAAQRLMPDSQQRQVLCHMLRRRINCTASSGTGRLFDGFAALLDLCLRNDFEAQAALVLESTAARSVFVLDSVNLFTIGGADLLELDFSPLVREILAYIEQARPADQLAALFHDQLARGWEAIVVAAAQRTGLGTVALSGGVFCNQRFTEALTDRLERRGLRVLRHRLVPPNDGGLSFGQAAVASAMLRMREKDKAGVPCV